MFFNKLKKLEDLQEVNWVDKCNFILDNYSKYYQVWLVFDYEPAMFFCNYYLLDQFNSMGFKNITVQPDVKNHIIMFSIGEVLIWSCTTLKKLKLDTERKVLPVHFSTGDFSLAFICKLQENDALKKKHRKIKNIYKDYKERIEKTCFIKMKR